MNRIYSTLLLVTFFAQCTDAQEVRARTRSGSFGIPEPQAKLSLSADFTEPSGNRLLDAGEKGLIKVTITNSGNAVARRVGARLTTTASPVGVTLSTPQTVGELVPNGSKTMVFEVSAQGDVPTQSITVTAEASDESGIKAESKTLTIATKERVLAKDETPPTIEVLEPKEISTRGMKTSGVTYTVTESSVRFRGLARDESGVAIVRINEREADIVRTQEGVEFNANVLLVLGENTVEVKAQDRFGNEGSARFTIRREAPLMVQEPKVPPGFFKGQRWAVVVGISSYSDSNIPQLRYADRDAREFHEILTRPLEQGGMGFPRSNVRFLADREATGTNIREALNDFLKQAIEDDAVIVYFAGHGAPDPDRPRVLYLLAHDSDLNRLGATAIKMQEVQDALRDYVVAKTVLVFVDACHSRGVSGATVATRSLASTELVNEYLAELARSRPSTLTFSASDVNQLSQEDRRWGGGHGVFTYHILEGLKGKANFDNDNLVRLGELLQYVTDNVRRETRAQQSPISSGSYDINLPMTIVREKQ